MTHDGVNMTGEIVATSSRGVTVANEGVQVTTKAKVRVREGSNWAGGLGFGLLMDAVFAGVASLLYVFTASHPSFGK